MGRQKKIKDSEYRYALAQRRKGAGNDYGSTRVLDPNYFETAWSGFWRPQEDLIDIYNQKMDTVQSTDPDREWRTTWSESTYWVPTKEKVTMITSTGRDTGRTRQGSSPEEQAIIDFAKDADLNPGKYVDFQKMWNRMKAAAIKAAKDAGRAVPGDDWWEGYRQWAFNAWTDSRNEENQLKFKYDASGRTIADIQTANAPADAAESAAEAAAAALANNLAAAEKERKRLEDIAKDKEKERVFQQRPQDLVRRNMNIQVNQSNNIRSDRPRDIYDGQVRYPGVYRPRVPQVPPVVHDPAQKPPTVAPS